MGLSDCASSMDLAFWLGDSSKSSSTVVLPGPKQLCRPKSTSPAIVVSVVSPTSPVTLRLLDPPIFAMPTNPTKLINSKQVSTELREKQLLNKAIGFLKNAIKQLNFHKMQSESGNLQPLQKTHNNTSDHHNISNRCKKTYQHNRATQTVDICNRCKYHITVVEKKT
jgi:hypothetical protein